MKLAVITDSSAYLPQHLLHHDDLFILDIPIYIDGESYVEGKNLTNDEFYQKMAASKELPKTSQPSVAALEELLSGLTAKGYTHALGLFLSSGISGFYQNIQYLKDEFEGLTVEFPDSKITSAPLGMMVEDSLKWAGEGRLFDEIVANVQHQIDGTTAYIMVDDLNHLVKGGRLSNGAAIIGNLLSIKPILHFNDQGVIEVFEKVRTEKKAIKRLVEIVDEGITGEHFQVFIIHANVPEKAEALRQMLVAEGVEGEIPFATFGGVIGTHLGDHSLAVGYIPIV
jgi:DegV family protein